MIRFSHPQYLMLLPLVWGFTWWVLRGSLAELGRMRGRLAAGVRAALLTLLVLAIAGIQYVRPTNDLCTVFVVDVSDSIQPSQRQVVLDYIHHALKNKHGKDLAALVAFGGEAMLDHSPDDKTAIGKIVSIPSTSRTDIAAGIQLAMASFDQEMGKQVVLFTDGNENLGNALDQAGLAESNGVRISVVPLTRDTSKGEALILRVETPSEVRQGAPFQINVLAESLKDVNGKITLYRDKQPVETRKVHLLPGKTVVAFEEATTHSGLYYYKAMLDIPADEDSVPDNNVAYAYTRVSGKPSVLVIEGVPGEGQRLVQAMQSHDIEVDYGGPERIPTNLAECTRYDSIIFANVPAWSMRSDQMTAIRNAVRDTGMGFAMLGGDQSFGAGGYFHTPIEEALPVSMDVKKKKVMPSVAIALIIENLEMSDIVNTSLAAAKSCIEGLQPIDQVGILGCGWGGYPGGGGNAGGNWEIPMQFVTNRGVLEAKVDHMQDLGDPSEYDSYLMEAANQLAKTQATVKHIILIGDGDATYESSNGALNGTMAKIRGMGVTVSTIATGIDGPQAAKFMASIATLGRGQSFEIKTPEDLPRYLVRDQQSVTKPPIYESPVNVHPDDTTHPVSRNIAWDTAPPLLGFDITSAKETPTVRVLLTAHEDDPVLAAWQYGLGHTVAFTSDATSHWGAHWLGWQEYEPFWSQALRWTLRPTFKSNFQTTVQEEDGKATISVDAVTPEGEYRNLLDLRAHISHVDATQEEGHQGSEETVGLEQTAPGHYEGHFDARGIGTYAIAVEELEHEKTKSMQMATLVIPYSPEFQAMQPNAPLITKIAEETGGTVEPVAEDIYGRMRFGSKSLHDLWPLLAVLGAILFLMDVAVRRVLMPWEEIMSLAWAAIRRRLPHRREEVEPEHDRVLGTLLNTKEQVRQPREGGSMAGTLREMREQSGALRGEFKPQAPDASLLKPADAPTITEPEAEEKPAITSGTVGTLLQKKRDRREK